MSDHEKRVDIHFHGLEGIIAALADRPMSRAILDLLREILANQVVILEKLDELIPHPPRPLELVLLQPTFTTLSGEPIMAAYQLKTNVVAHFVITETDPSGALVPVDPADVFTVVSSDPTNLQAVIDKNDAGATTLSVNWLHTTTPMLTGVGVSITDSQGNTADNAETFDMVAPAHVADQIGIDVPNVVETPQAVPV